MMNADGLGYQRDVDASGVRFTNPALGKSLEVLLHYHLKLCKGTFKILTSLTLKVQC